MSEDFLQLIRLHLDSIEKYMLKFFRLNLFHLFHPNSELLFSLILAPQNAKHAPISATIIPPITLSLLLLIDEGNEEAIEVHP